MVPGFKLCLHFPSNPQGLKVNNCNCQSIWSGDSWTFVSTIHISNLVMLYNFLYNSTTCYDSICSIILRYLIMQCQLVGWQRIEFMKNSWNISESDHFLLLIEQRVKWWKPSYKTESCNVTMWASTWPRTYCWSTDSRWVFW